MVKLIIFFCFGIPLMLFTTSCLSTKTTASGAKHKSFSNFSFLINNNQTTTASVYKRYINNNNNNNKRKATRVKVKGQSAITKNGNKSKLAPKNWSLR